MRNSYIRTGLVTATAVFLTVGTAIAGGDKTSDGKMGGAAATRQMSQDFDGRHTMEGSVTRIDNAKGTFSLKTAEGMTLDLHAPPSALQGVKTGDRLAVEIAVKHAGTASMPNSTPSASPRTDDMKGGADPLKSGAGTEQPKTGADAPAPGPTNRPAQNK